MPARAQADSMDNPDSRPCSNNLIVRVFVLFISHGSSGRPQGPVHRPPRTHQPTIRAGWERVQESKFRPIAGGRNNPLIRVLAPRRGYHGRMMFSSYGPLSCLVDVIVCRISGRGPNRGFNFNLVARWGTSFRIETKRINSHRFERAALPEAERSVTEDRIVPHSFGVDIQPSATASC